MDTRTQFLISLSSLKSRTVSLHIHGSVIHTCGWESPLLDILPGGPLVRVSHPAVGLFHTPDPEELADRDSLINAPSVGRTL